jgi:hypothetical protein
MGKAAEEEAGIHFAAALHEQTSDVFGPQFFEKPAKVDATFP